MSERKRTDRKYYLKNKLVRLGYDVANKSLHELEELHAEHKRQTVMMHKMGDIKKQDRYQEKGRPEHHVDELPSETDVDDFYKIKSGGRTEREARMKDYRFLNLLDKIRIGYIPTALEVSQYSAKQQREILILIPWNAHTGGQSPLIYGKSRKKRDRSRAVRIW